MLQILLMQPVTTAKTVHEYNMYFLIINYIEDCIHMHPPDILVKLLLLSTHALNIL